MDWLGSAPDWGCHVVLHAEAWQTPMLGKSPDLSELCTLMVKIRVDF
jgi:hypothetical protein